MVKINYILKSSYVGTMRSMLLLFIFMDFLGLYFILSIIGRVSILYPILLFIYIILSNIFYFFYLLDIFEPYIIEIEGKSLKIITKRKRVLREFDICKVKVPLISLKIDFHDKFIKKNKGVYMYFSDDLRHGISIGKGFIRYGRIPMREAVEIENWIKEWKKKLCETNTNKGGDER